MRKLIRRYAIPVVMIATIVIAIVTTGHTLALIQRRQHNEDLAIRCLVDARCSAALHGHAHAGQPAARSTVLL